MLHIPDPEKHQQTLDRAKQACAQMDVVVAALDDLIEQWSPSHNNQNSSEPSFPRPESPQP
jgi:hypothetical protein